ncbi:polyamine-transporting ATPase 13A3 isoform X2 [Episyrphus balteatus]|uniref:polyamine-transporting ATPase 13A3 isoform X2 n=1 Tax=Episyrphus balteatus TaxID=286459 RepID=UPI002485F07D|nr:polyamine-transporting ATPase 13A3 isoform X2 [Episyrphus balteatus]
MAKSNPCEGLLNPNEEDAMKITGYRRSKSRTYLCWFCICLTAGLLRLVLHWWRHWFLLATHSQCSLAVAERVLIQEDYQGKHKVYYIKDVVTLSLDSIKNMQKGSKLVSSHLLMDNEIDEKNFHLSVHFSSGVFKHTDSVRVILCKQLRYVWDAQSQTFIKLTGLDVDIPSTYLHHVRGLTAHEQFARRIVYGLNEITVPYKGVVTLLFLEVLNPFYVFQIFSVILWFSYNYYYYAVVIIFMSAFGITMSIIQTKKNQDALYSTVQNSDCAQVLTENGDVKDIKTKYLVPGDIIEIPSTGCTLQCDAVLLSGNCILDESMLTGESVPVTKTPLPIKRDLIFEKKEHSRHTLFCGTKVIQTRYIGSEKVLAIVINTGNITAKGGLIRSILYPPPVDYKFEQDSYKFIAILGLIAFVGFFYTLITKILRGVDAVKIAVESLDLITIVVPPALPAAMTVGRFYAQQRLEKKNIFCISPRSINVSGSIDCVCFDKTGTLTEDGLDMWGVVPKSQTNYFQIALKQIDRLPVDHFLFGMVTCHSITIMNGEKKGDPLDLKMFESTGWILEDANVPDGNKYDLLFPTIVRQPKSNRVSTDSIEEEIEDFHRGSVDDLLADVGGSNDIGIVREFPFTSALQRMSVITRRLTDNHFNVYCKGSPEMIHTLSDPSTIPDNYFAQLDVYAQQGFRIIALAYKPLEKKMTYPKVQRVGRDKIECDLEFLGFVILENRLKPDTTEVIKCLTLANIRTIMVTGDNILTALSVAKDCGIVGKKQSVITVNTRISADNPNKHELYYNLIGAVTPNEPAQNGNGDICSLNTHSSSIGSLETCDTWTHRDVELGLTDLTPTAETNGKSIFDEKKMFPDLPSNNYRFAMVGKTWSIVREHFPEYVQQFVTRGAIFARMSPDQKQSLIMELQEVNYYVAMCGDGANDCGALKVAHTGISLSEAESSIASPFTSRNPTIACVPNVIREGRAALVTSFGIFKYMAAYSLVQFISVLILYSIDSNLTDKQFLYIDLGLISIFAFFFGKTQAYDGPLVKQPPLNSLISITPMASIILHLLVVIAFQVAGWFYLLNQSWFFPFQPDPDPEGNHLGCLENYTMFVISCFQYIILAFVFSKGAPYRKSIISNIPFCLSLLVNLSFVIYMTLYPAQWLIDSFELVMPPDQNFRYLLIIYGAVNFIISLILEAVVVEYLLFKKIRHHFHNIEKSHRKYLAIENELRRNTKWPPLSDFSNVISNEYDKPSPTSYAEISAEHQIDMKAPENSVLNSFFDVVKVGPNQHDKQQDADENMSLSDIYSESCYESAINEETIFDGFSSENDNSLACSQQSIMDTNSSSNNIRFANNIHSLAALPSSSQSSSPSPRLPLSLPISSPTPPPPQSQPQLPLVTNDSLQTLQLLNHNKLINFSPVVPPVSSNKIDFDYNQQNSDSSSPFTTNININTNTNNPAASIQPIQPTQPELNLASIQFKKSFRVES